MLGLSFPLACQDSLLFYPSLFKAGLLLFTLLAVVHFSLLPAVKKRHRNEACEQLSEVSGNLKNEKCCFGCAWMRLEKKQGDFNATYFYKALSV